MRPVVATAALCLATGAHAAEVGADVELAGTVVPGSPAPDATVGALSGDVAIDGSSSPSFRFGLGGTLRATAHRADYAASWGLFRDQALCDTCDDGGGPGWSGSELLGSSDLTLTAGRTTQLAALRVRVAADVILPASRDALSCNPLFGAPGISMSSSTSVSASTIRISGRASRPIYAFDAVPVGRCAPSLEGPGVATLTGLVDPEPWSGERAGRPNPVLSLGTGLAWTNPHALFGGPGIVSSGASIGLDASKRRSSGSTEVRTATGTVVVEDAFRPWTGAVPWSAWLGVAPTDRFDLSLSVANRVPTLLADPGATLRALPNRTAITLAATGHL